MIETPKIVESSNQLTAFIHLVVPREEIQRVMGPAIGEIFSTLSAQGIVPVGPWFTHHRSRPTEVFDFEAAVPIASKVAEIGRVRAGELGGARVARTVYRGGYEGLASAWSELMDWVRAQGHTRRPDLWECYTLGPESSADSTTWLTELNQPLIDALPVS